MKKYTLWLAVVVAVVALVATVVMDIDAGMKRWNNPSIATTLNPAAIDTSSSIAVSYYDEIFLMVAYEGDSSSVTVQGSMDGTNWYELLAAVTLNGVDGTYALQYYKPITMTTSGAKTDIAVPPGNYLRVILNNNDAAGDDTLGTIHLNVFGK